MVGSPNTKNMQSRLRKTAHQSTAERSLERIRHFWLLFLPPNTSALATTLNPPFTSGLFRPPKAGEKKAHKHFQIQHSPFSGRQRTPVFPLQHIRYRLNDVFRFMHLDAQID